MFQSALNRFLLFYSEILNSQGQKILEKTITSNNLAFKFYIADLLHRFEFEFKKLRGLTLGELCKEYLEILVGERVFSAGWAELYKDKTNKEIVAFVTNYLHLEKYISSKEKAEEYYVKSLNSDFGKHDPTGIDMDKSVEKFGFLVRSVLRRSYLKKVYNLITADSLIGKLKQWFRNKRGYLSSLFFIILEKISDIIFMPLLNEFSDKKVIGYITGLNRKKDIEQKLKELLIQHNIVWENLSSKRKKQYFAKFHQINKHIIFPIANHFLKIHVHDQTLNRERLEGRWFIPPALITDGHGIVQNGNQFALDRKSVV